MHYLLALSIWYFSPALFGWFCSGKLPFFGRRGSIPPTTTCCPYRFTNVNQRAGFDRVLCYNHDVLPDAATDTFHSFVPSPRPSRSNGWVTRVQITDIVVGDGAAADTGKGVTFKWVMRRSNGYYVSSSSEGDGEPFIYRVSTAVFASKISMGDSGQ